MESALADAASALSVALKMRSCMVYTDLRPVPICASVPNRERRSHDDACSSEQLPRSPGHVTSSQLIICMPQPQHNDQLQARNILAG